MHRHENRFWFPEFPCPKVGRSQAAPGAVSSARPSATRRGPAETVHGAFFGETARETQRGLAGAAWPGPLSGHPAAPLPGMALVLPQRASSVPPRCTPWGHPGTTTLAAT